MFSPGSTLNKKRSGQGDESRQRKRSEAHWSLYDKSSTTNLTLNKFFSKNFFMHAPRLLPRVRHPTAHNRLRTREAFGSNSPFPPPIWPKPQIARMRKKVRGKPRTRSLPLPANLQVFPFRKLPRFWASAHARWKNKFANSSKPIASAASVRPRAETGKSWHEDSANESPPKMKSWSLPTANGSSTASIPPKIR